MTHFGPNIAKTYRIQLWWWSWWSYWLESTYGFAKEHIFVVWL